MSFCLFADYVTKFPVQWPAKVWDTLFLVLEHFDAKALSPILVKNYSQSVNV